MCSHGALGLITESELQLVVYKQCANCALQGLSGSLGVHGDAACFCETVEAYVGIHLTDKIAKIGSRWCSRNPMIVGKLRTGLMGFGNLPDVRPEAARAFCEIINWENTKC